MVKATTRQISQSKSRPPTNQLAEAARNYLRLDFKPILLEPLNKKPVHAGWQNQPRLTEEQVPRVFTGNHNIGLQYGPASGGLVDAEFDSESARALAPRFMPPTRAVFGRKSKPRSHWLYRCPALHDGAHGAVIKIQDGDGKEVASLRIGDDGKGAQSMAPPSIHPSGEAVEWAEGCGPEPAAIGVELERAFRYTCIASLLADIWPREASNRDGIAMAAAGWLARHEVMEEQATAIIEAAAESAGDDEVRKRLQCVQDTYRKYENGDNIVGWNTLTQLIDGRAAKALRTALAAKSRFPDLTKDGAPRANSPHNVVVALEQLGIECRYNLFSLEYSVNGHPLADFVGELTDPALFRLRELIFERVRLTATVTTVKEAVYTAANHHRYHPVRDYLDGLKWDGVPRIDKWLSTYGGADDTPYTNAVGALVLTAAVRRVRQPGCKFDETLVLEGEQGDNKSGGLKVLAVKPEWFSDSLSFNLRGREAIEQTTGVWIVEIPELRGLRASDRDKRKAFQSRDTDSARLAYGYTVTRARRQYVPIATTNDISYLDDLTGNRRFWPVAHIKFDLEALERDRDQLWAEAAAREASGASIRLPEELWAAAAAEQQARMFENPFLSVLDRLLRERGGTGEEGPPMQGKIAVEDLWTLLDIKPAQRSQKHNEHLGDAMKQLGWERKSLRVGGGRRAYHFVRGSEPYKRIIGYARTNDTPAFAAYGGENPWF
jgi:hypothetical protein